jgi:hypothetical protein
MRERLSWDPAGDKEIEGKQPISTERETLRTNSDGVSAVISNTERRHRATRFRDHDAAQIDGSASIAAKREYASFMPRHHFSKVMPRGSKAPDLLMFVVHVVQKPVVRAPRKTHTALTTTVCSGQQR